MGYQEQFLDYILLSPSMVQDRYERDTNHELSYFKEQQTKIKRKVKDKNKKKNERPI